MLDDKKYWYDAHCVSAYDGDTVTVDIDLGFGNKMTKQKLRLYGINTPEIRGKEREDGIVSRDWLRKRILDKDIVMRSYRDKSGKYGRWLAEIFIEQDGELLNLNLEMVRLGLAKENFYK